MNPQFLMLLVADVEEKSWFSDGKCPLPQSYSTTR
eukprot:CAMPEP_0195339854 /NCGR_PEP_ID=MMETSP0708-20121125/18467_1 /TAXON_ID=33640 /ORGANISM="Asterionellopsis glacialis, Strain CCMP134" /LENGTH=34 /DNA_ID= /DNA_START= /DNA_END= /DNA_ORIENTATION=